MGQLPWWHEIWAPCGLASGMHSADRSFRVDFSVPNQTPNNFAGKVRVRPLLGLPVAG